MKGNIFLIGLMGSGKTTVGRQLARRLNKTFIDSDHEIEARTGASIPLIFEIEGEASFRQREEEVISDLTKRDDLVLATGGGAILNPHNRALLGGRGTVIYLRASVHSILQRTGRDKNRPLLQTADPRRVLEELSRQRDPLYRAIADIIIDTGRPNVQFLVNSILMQLQARGVHIPAPSPHSIAPTMNQHLTPHSTQHPTQNQITAISNMPINSLRVELGERSYPIEIGQALLTDSERMARLIKGAQVVVITNAVVAPLYLDSLRKSLLTAGKKIIEIILPDGEAEKNWTSLM
ncbi:MAG: shikimate kinase AroK, partial [Glaciimonas sp.]|nr:shikimate kinase AroK [Glaciimonas sp.]